MHCVCCRLFGLSSKPPASCLGILEQLREEEVTVLGARVLLQPTTTTDDLETIITEADVFVAPISTATMEIRDPTKPLKFYNGYFSTSSTYARQYCERSQADEFGQRI